MDGSKALHDMQLSDSVCACRHAWTFVRKYSHVRLYLGIVERLVTALVVKHELLILVIEGLRVCHVESGLDPAKRVDVMGRVGGCVHPSDDCREAALACHQAGSVVPIDGVQFHAINGRRVLLSQVGNNRLQSLPPCFCFIRHPQSLAAHACMLLCQPINDWQPMN